MLVAQIREPAPWVAPQMTVDAEAGRVCLRVVKNAQSARVKLAMNH